MSEDIKIFEKPENAIGRRGFLKALATIPLLGVPWEAPSILAPMLQ